MWPSTIASPYKNRIQKLRAKDKQNTRTSVTVLLTFSGGALKTRLTIYSVMSSYSNKMCTLCTKFMFAFCPLMEQQHLKQSCHCPGVSSCEICCMKVFSLFHTCSSYFWNSGIPLWSQNSWISCQCWISLKYVLLSSNSKHALLPCMSYEQPPGIFNGRQWWHLSCHNSGGS
jgi:hypothetical protein